MGTNPKVSVIIPTYNRAGFLPATLRSILTQSLTIHELFLVDDGSTDDTAATVADFLAENANWRNTIKYLRQENSGKSVALNLALQKVTGDWIAFDDSDDIWHKDKLLLQFEALNRFPHCGACFTDARLVNNPKRKGSRFERVGRRCAERFGIEPNILPSVIDGTAGVLMQTIMLRSEIMQSVGPFDPALRVSQDMDFLFRLALRTSLCFVNMVLVDVDRTPGRSEGLNTQFDLKSLVRLRAQEHRLTKWLSLPETPDELHSRIKRQLRRVYSEIANCYLINEDLRSARSSLVKSMQLSFSLKTVGKWVGLLVASSLIKQRLQNANPVLPVSTIPQGDQLSPR
jgi:glycosyltransferase involved in cell wall biosynthesis